MNPFATIQVRTLLAPLVRVEVPGRLALGLAAAFAGYALHEGYRGVGVDGWRRVDLVDAGNQICNQPSPKWRSFRRHVETCATVSWVAGRSIPKPHQADTRDSQAFEIVGATPSPH